MTPQKKRQLLGKERVRASRSLDEAQKLPPVNDLWLALALLIKSWGGETIR